MITKEELIRTFESRALKTDSCWIWKDKPTTDGYGRLKLRTGKSGGSTISAHRLAYVLFKGEIPKELVIDHICENRICVNPEHLQLVTREENVKKAAREGHYIGRRNNVTRGIRLLEKV